MKTAGAAAAGTVISGAPAVHAKNKYEWKMVTVWPEDLPGMGAGIDHLARMIELMSGGRISVRVFPAGKLVSAFEAFDAVAEGTAQLGHAPALYWKNKHEAFAFFASIPFGLNTHEMMTWIQFGGGLKLMDELYGRYNLKPFPGGATGAQMGGWYNREIISVDDFKGLKIRMPALGGKVLAKLGADVVFLPGSEIFRALDSGDIEAAEWIAPFDDLRLELYKVAKYYYWPGWHQPTAMCDCFMNKNVYESLPVELREIVRHACFAMYSHIWSGYSANNGNSLVQLIQKHKIRLRRFPERVLAELARVSRSVVEEIADKDPFSRKVFDSYNAFRKQAVGWTQIGEEAFSLARSLTYSYLD